MSAVDTTRVLPVLRWWARPTQRFFGAPRIASRVARNHRRAMRALRDGRLDEILEATKNNFRFADWPEIDSGLPPPEAVHPSAATWTGAVDGVTVAARLVAVSRFGDALQYLRDAERLADATSPLARGLLLAAQGGCLHLLGNGEAALAAAESALGHLVTTGEAVVVAEAGLQAIRTRGLVHDEHQITDELRRVWDAFRRADDRTGAADCLLEQAMRELRAGAPEAARRTAGHAKEVLADDHGWSALACEIAVVTCVASAQVDGHGATAKLAKRARNENLLLDDPWWRWQLDCAVAEASLAAGDRKAAAKPIESSLQGLERLRFRVGDVGQRAGWFVPKMRPFEHALDQALRDSRPERALEIAERVGRSALAHMLLARATQADRETSLQASRLLALSGAPSGRTGQELLDDAAERDRDVIAMLARRNAVLAATVSADAPIDIPTLLQALGHDVFLALLETPRGIWRICGDSTAARAADLVLPEQSHDQTLAILAADNPEDLLAWLRQPEALGALDGLGPLLLPEPLSMLLSTGRSLTVVAGGRLARVPFAALRLEGRPLVDRCAIRVTPSLGLLAALRRQRARPATAGPLLLAPEPEGLIGAAEQVRDLQNVWHDAIAVEGERASLANLARLSDAGSLAAARALVVAAHGEPHASDPLRSGIRLGDGAILAAGSALALRLPAQVELWSCSSASEPAATSGPEIAGLLAACLSAGARRVLASLWPLPDSDAAVLAGLVHQRLARGSSLSEALAQAQRELCEQLPLVSWAALVAGGLADEAVT